MAERSDSGESPVRFGASLSSFRLHPLVPGLFWFRAHAILRANDHSPLPPDGPTRPKQQFPTPERDDSIPHPEPPLLLIFFPVAPDIPGLPVGVPKRILPRLGAPSGLASLRQPLGRTAFPGLKEASHA